MTIETTVNDLVASVGALTASVVDKRTVLDNAAQQAAASLVTTQQKEAEATGSAAAAAASASAAASAAADITAYKTAATALNTSTTATQAVTNLLPDLLAKKDPARHPFRGKLPTLVLDFERQAAHKFSPLTGLVRQAISDVVTFTRASTATYTGPDGLIKTAAVNEPRYDYDPLTGECKGLLVEEQRTNSLALGAATWTTYNWGGVTPTLVRRSNILSPDGSLTTFKAYEAAATSTEFYLRKIAWASAAAGAYCISVYVHSRSERTLWLRVVHLDCTQLTSEISFDMSTKSFGSRRGYVTATGYNDAGSGWYRVWMVFTTPTTSSVQWGVNLYGGTTTGDGVSGLYLWGPQIEAGAFPTSYIPSTDTFTGRTSTATYLDVNGVVQTAGVGVARSAAYDYDSDGVLRPIGLLLEKSATNLLLYSQDLTNAAWTKYGSGVATAPVVTGDYATAPDGTMTADRVQMALNSGATVDDYSRLEQLVSTVAGTTYTASVWLKTADASTKQVQLSFYGENPSTVTVTGTWQRFSITGTASDTGRGFRLALRGTYGTSDSADLLVWGAQQGVGNYPTSYIPTTSAQVTRAADTSTSAQATRAKDTAKVDGVNFNDWYNIDGFTAFATYEWGVDVNQQVFGRGVFGFSDTNNSNNWCYVYNGNACSALVANTNSGQQFYKTSGSPNEPANVMRSIAFRYKKNNAAVSFNGGSVASDTNCELPVFNNLTIGSTSLTNTPRLGGHVKRIVVYPTAFTNEELQAATSA